jgi:septum site-determining protein MinD
MRIIGVLSGKGGVGKTTTVANTGIALTDLYNKRVLLLDGNSTTPDLALHLGLYSLPYTLEDVLEGKVNIRDAIYHHPSGVDILPSSMSITESGVDLRDLKRFFDELREYEMMFFDSPPGLGKGIRATLEIAGEVLVVTNPEVPAITDALRLVEVASKAGVTIRGVVLNRVRGEKYELSLPEVESVFDVPVVASIPEDSRVRESIAFGEPIVSHSPYSPAAVAFKKLAAKLVGREYTVGLLDRLRALLGLGRRKVAPRYKIEIKPVERRPLAEVEKKEELKERIPGRVETPVMHEEKPRIKEVEVAPPPKEKPREERLAVPKMGREWSRFLAPPYRSKAPGELMSMGVEVIQGIDEGYKEKLVRAGYRTVEELATARVEEVSRKAGLSAPLSDYFIAAARAISEAAGG